MCNKKIKNPKVYIRDLLEPILTSPFKKLINKKQSIIIWGAVSCKRNYNNQGTVRPSDVEIRKMTLTEICELYYQNDKE